MHNGTNGNTPPIVYPTITIRDETYILKVGLNARYRFENYGISDLGEAVKRLQAAGKDQQFFFKVLASIAGKETTRGLWKPLSLPDIELDELPETLSAELADRLGEVVDAVSQAFVKAFPPTPAAPSVEQASAAAASPIEIVKTDGSTSGPSESAQAA